jgi:alkylation response protein AidB-like acyl-CoA dehydrogenase
MDLSLSETEEQMVASVRSFVNSEVIPAMREEPIDSDIGLNRSWLQTMAQAGWLGLGISSDYGGAGASVFETALAFEQLGRGPVPIFPLTSLASAHLLEAVATAPVKQDLLPAVSAGTAVCTVGGLDGLWSTTWGQSRLSCRRAAASYILDGLLTAVPFAGSATDLLVVVPDADGYVVALVDGGHDGVECRLLSGFLGWHYEVSFSAVEVDALRCFVVPDPGVLTDALRIPMLMAAAYAAGGCEQLVKMSRDYCNERIQFGQPIGRFQRVQDHMVRALNAYDSARWTMYKAAWDLDVGNGDGPASVHLAKSVAAESYMEAADAAHEVHAGIGSDPKFGLAIYTRVSRTLYHFLGAPGWHRGQLIAALRSPAEQGGSPRPVRAPNAP